MLNKYLTPISQPSYMEWVDWTKIIGIFLVTLGHGNLVSVELNTFIYSFHMPLFFILSGILFKYRNFIESLKKGWHTLLVPYFIINLIILAYTSILLILKGTFDVQMFLGKVVAVIVGLGYNVGYLSPVSAPICIGVFLILQYYEIDTLVPIDSTLLAMPFFIAGYEMKEFFKRDLSFYVVLIIFVALIVFNYYNGRVDINTCQIGNSLLLFYLNGMFGTICVFQIARYLQLGNKISLIASGTIIILGFNLLMIKYAKVVWNFIFSSIPITSLVGILLASVILAVFIPIILFCKKHFKCILGYR